MMVPADGKFFFTNDVLRGMNTGVTAANHVSQAEDAREDKLQQEEDKTPQ